jgi:hypothetical protein
MTGKVEMAVIGKDRDSNCSYPFIETREIIEKVGKELVLPSMYFLYYRANGGCIHDWSDISICKLCGWSRGPVRDFNQNNKMRDILLFAATEMSKTCKHTNTIWLYVGGNNKKYEVCRDCGTPLEWKKLLKVEEGKPCGKRSPTA